MLGGDEIAVLVEDVVSGEEGFGLAEDDLAAAQHGDGIGSAFSGVPVGAADVAGHDGNGEVRGVGGELLDSMLGVREEAGLFDQVAGRVAGDGEFGKDDEVGAARGGVAGEAGHEGAVAGQVADRGVDLAQGDAHEPIF